MKIAIVGAGVLGTSLGMLLQRAGHSLVALCSRTKKKAKSAAGHLGNVEVVGDPGLAAMGADLVLLAVPDREIEGVVEQVVAGGALRRGAVVAHLAGGMTHLALLVWYFLQRTSFSIPARGLRLPAVTALSVVGIQILLSGWVSANYAALACPDLPLCLGQALPPMDFANAFHVLRELGRTDDGGLLPHDALVAIQWSHRVFALIVVATVGFAAWKTWKIHRPVAAAIGGLLLLQFSLGAANVAFNLPLALAAAHNAGAAALLCALVVLNFSAFRDDSSTSR